MFMVRVVGRNSRCLYCGDKNWSNDLEWFDTEEEARQGIKDNPNKFNEYALYQVQAITL